MIKVFGSKGAICPAPSQIPLPLLRNTSSCYITPLSGDSWTVQMVSTAIFFLRVPIYKISCRLLVTVILYTEHQLITIYSVTHVKIQEDQRTALPGNIFSFSTAALHCGVM